MSTAIGSARAQEASPATTGKVGKVEMNVAARAVVVAIYNHVLKHHKKIRTAGRSSTCPTARTTAGSPTSASCRSTSSRSLRFTVQSCNREVFAMTPDGVERNEPGAWDFTLAAIAHELNERFGPPLPSRCKVH